MYRSLPVLLVGLCIACLAPSSCQFSTAKIEKTVLCKKFDDKGLPSGETAVFDVKDAAIHCGVKVIHIPSETPLRAIWYSIDPSTKQRKEMVQSDFKVSDDRWVNFLISPPPQGFAAGSYAVDIYLNDKLDNSLSFTIAGPEQSPLVSKVLLAGKDASGTLTENYTYPPSIDAVHAQVSIKEAPADTKFRAEWYQHDAATNNRALIVSTDFNIGGTDVIDFTLTPTAPLPAGRYSVDILVGGKVSNTGLFEVK